MTEFIGFRLERHNRHMAAVRAVQRRGQYDRLLGRAIAEHRLWDRQDVLTDRERETLALLVDLRDDLAQRMRAEGQKP